MSEFKTSDAADSSFGEKTIERSLQENSPRWLQWAFKVDSIGFEARGIERVTPEERRELASNQKHSKLMQLIHVMGLWFAACGGLTTMSSFFLPTLIYGLNVKDSMVSGIVSMVIGCLVPAYTSTMGAKSGLRQMVSARFLFGWWGVRFIAVVCIVGGVGWSVVNCVLGGQVLSAISSGKLPLEVGIVIIAVISLVVAVFGIKVLLRFQTILAIPIAVAAILFYVVVCKKSDYFAKTDAQIAEQRLSSATSRGNWLSFFTVGYSVTATWGSGAADYYILFPEDTPSYQVFLLTFLGIAIPSAFVSVSAVLCGCIAYSYEPWNNAYNDYGIGGLLEEAFKAWGGFGKFVVVLFYISLVCNNIMNTYSCAFEFQLIDKKLAMVPRWIWATLVTIIYLAISLAGRSHLSTIISNFLPMLGYWISMYITILLEENLLFRGSESGKKLHHQEFAQDADEELDNSAPIQSWVKDLYNWDMWDNPKYVTLGLAASASFAIGVVGAVVGMNQTYWQGPIARKIGENGGDIGFWLCMAFSGVSYPLLRYFELKKFGR
ncbi:vitamin B6 transporter Tpn1p [[Candida] railenensis]|uniref:Vitamin B6 transporter Tpn1p n=1 Tax=[Candida] railenensis TaxID=45579 RepID=A0A9P0QKD8_9ASCO|nr:vitamin B6 transporter Tpn1p [[Candida] railenensis]